MSQQSKLRVRELDWRTIFGIMFVHALAVAAPFYWSMTGLVLAIVLTAMTGWIGITLCYHRLLTHKSFDTPRWFRYILTLVSTLAWQGGPLKWVGVHRIHHAHSDKDLDPHSPQHGFTWSHIFWLFFKNPEGQDPHKFTKDLQRDKGIVFIDKYFWVTQVLLTLGLFFGGYFAFDLDAGISWVAWGIGVRTVFVYHGTWFVNSAAHTWGYRNFATEDGSRNNWWVALLSFGEGWHNNHHAQQRSAAHGMKWWEFDLTYWTIKVLEKVGLAWNVVEPKPM